MNERGRWMRLVSALIIVALIVPLNVGAQDAGGKPAFKQEQLEQLLAPIALYPDSLLTQILMASTYPLEVVQADRWAKQNKDLKGDALTKALEKQTWDPSVKSLVNFPQVLTMMSEKLDVTQKIGDAFLAQQKDVMDTIQKLRKKAEASGNLKTTKEQVVKVEREVIIIESASPQVVYVPSYNPTVVYGTWAYPAYPPYPYYPPGYGAGAAFVTGVAIGAAWGYAWGHANWGGGNVDVDVNRNTNVNKNINRQNYQQQMQKKGQVNQAGKGSWQHDASHRGGVAYRDQGTAKKFGQSSASAKQASQGARGYSDRGAGAQASSVDKGARGDSGKAGGAGGGGRDSAFSGASQGGFDRQASERGQASKSGQMSSSSRSGGGASSGAARGGGGGGGGSRGGGGGGRR
jgi:Protein of unknown function (DUF3300)